MIKVVLLGAFIIIASATFSTFCASVLYWLEHVREGVEFKNKTLPYLSYLKRFLVELEVEDVIAFFFFFVIILIMCAFVGGFAIEVFMS